jgi:archaetidylinositol phosphate synthase
MDIRYPVTQYVYRPLSVPLASAIARTPITPVQVTWGSAALTFAGAVAFGFQAYVLGAALTLAGVITDCVDGDLARLTGRSSQWGAFLDSVLDRWTDAALILGLGFSDPDGYGAVAGLALVGSLLTSYTRARSQSLGVDCPDGVGGRDTRVLILVCAGLSGFILSGLVAVAVVGGMTSVHRMAVAGRELRRLDKAKRHELPQ